MNDALKNRTVVVTGAGRGIGQTVALAIAQAHGDVIAVARTADQLDETIERAKGLPGRIHKIVGDVTDAATLSATVTLANAQGNVHGLVCAAGIYGPIGALETVPQSQWEEAFRVNVFASVAFVRAFAGIFRRGGGGRVILFSGGGEGAMPNFSAYVASKGAIWRLTETLAAELASDQIFVNAIAPGAVNTQFLEEVLAAGAVRAGALYAAAQKQKASGGTPPSKAAELCLYLLDAASSGLSGKILSAVWDDYRAFQNLTQLSQQDWYTMRRKVPPRA